MHSPAPHPATLPCFAEYVSPGHPDRLADAIAESLVTEATRRTPRALCGVEVAVHDDTVFIDGRIAADGEHIDTRAIACSVYQSAGYGGTWLPAPRDLQIHAVVCNESLTPAESAIRQFADDQNIITGHACGTAATNHLPPAQFLAINLGHALFGALRATTELAGIFGPDMKLLCVLRPFGESPRQGLAWDRLVLSVQHRAGLSMEAQHRILAPIIHDLLGQWNCPDLPGIATDFDPLRHLHLNGAGDFVVGGPRGDNGLSGKKLVVDHYGPGVAIGGGALCGKDPWKIDRCGALRARQLAKSLVRDGADTADVVLSWAPGESVPAHRHAITHTRGKSRVLGPADLPPADWFAIETIVNDLGLLSLDWPSILLRGFFADPTLPWEH